MAEGKKESRVQICEAIIETYNAASSAVPNQGENEGGDPCGDMCNDLCRP